MMESHLGSDSPPVKRESSSCPKSTNISGGRPLDGDFKLEERHDLSVENTSNQLVLYKPHETDATLDVSPISSDIKSQTSSFQNFISPAAPSRDLLSIGVFSVQCAACFKWRIIPTKEKYEEIREKILQEYFVCDHGREWRPDISCDDPADISPDGSRLWAIDKPNIVRPPPGWERLLRLRSEGSSKFADVYYVAPSGKRFRSMGEIEKYLLEHPEYISEGVKMSHFSFQTPRPLQENYLRKRPTRMKNLDADVTEMPANHVPVDVNSPSPLELMPPPAKKKKPTRHSTKQAYNAQEYDQTKQAYNAQEYDQPNKKLEETQQERYTPSFVL